MLSVAICDDDPSAGLRLKQRIPKLLDGERCRIQTYSSRDDFSAAVDEEQAPDIVFMDIELGDRDSGIELVRQLFSAGSSTQVIYLTAYVEYCSAVYETRHTYFLQKPATDELLKRALDKAMSNLAEGKRTVCFSINGKSVCLPVDEIVYFESSYRKLTIHTSGETIQAYSTISQAAQKTGSRFLQCHKSFLVNMDRVKTMERSHFIMDDSSYVPISRGMLQKTRERFFEYLGEL